MKVFLTGATGYLGSKLLSHLLATDHEVIALYRKDKLDLEQPGLTWVQGSLEHTTAIEPLLQGVDTVYHTAALAAMWHKKRSTFYDVSVRATENLLQASKQQEVKNFVFTSSAVVLSYSIKSAIKEDDPLIEPLIEDYAVTKSMAEQAVMSASTANFKTVVVNPPRIYGPSSRGFNAVNNLVRNYLNNRFYFMPGNGSYIGNYAYIDDVVLGHILARNKGQSGHRYIVGGENHTYVSLFNLLQEITGKKRTAVKLPYRIMRWVAGFEESKAQLTGLAPWVTSHMVDKLFSNRALSSEKAVSHFNYTITPLKEGLERTISHIKHSSL
ncbi:MAG TPA: NAD-dependent epimerase/dehydratase family protein [Cyclobacteriaceae bacterium]|nr:NAD-dependent epimerase/dehydratase family protein [Cyclobacteriaceae bacterium]